MPEEPLRDRIGHYVIESALGRGSMGAVYLARDERIGRRVAIKQVHGAKAQFEDAASADEFYKRLQREAEVCGALQHPNIVTLYDVGYEEGRISWLALEYVAGETLLELLKRHRPQPLPLEVTLRIAGDILRGLAYAHRQGIVHRDIKPANVLIAQDGTAKIADFGIARPQGSSMTLAGSLLGTPNYMSPEQVKGTGTTPQSDLFSMGVVLFEMLTARKPFAAPDLSAVLENIVKMPTPEAETASPHLNEIIQRLTAKQPEARYASASEALAALENVRVPVSAAMPPPASEEPTQRTSPPESPLWRRRVPMPVFAAATLAALLAGAIPTAILWSRIDDRPTAEISEAQLAEFERKRDALNAADRLFDEGKYRESLEAYEAYLVRYPHSTVAREGADRAREALATEKKPAQTTTTAAAPKPKEEKRSILQNLKRGVKKIFRR